MTEQKFEMQIAEYEKLKWKYELFSTALAELLRSILIARGIKFHTIEHRAKSVDSFAAKVRRPRKNYANPLKEINDLAGCRIITFYLDDVDTVGDIVKEEFDVLEQEMSHQTSELDADRFGYLSAHFVIKLSKERASLSEWRAYADLRSELQLER